MTNQKGSRHQTTEGRFAKVFLSAKKIKPPPAGKTVPVKIDERTTIYISPGTDINAAKKKYLENLAIISAGNIQGKNN